MGQIGGHKKASVIGFGHTWLLWSMKNVRPSSAVRASQPVGTDEKQPEARGQLAAPVGGKRPARDGGRKGGHSRGGCACIAGRCCRASVSPVFLCVCSLATATEGVTSNIVILDLSMYNEAAICSLARLAVCTLPS